MSDTWEPAAAWVDSDRGYTDGDELEPLDEVAARVRGYRQGDLQAFLAPAARWEQDLHPFVLAADDEHAVRAVLTSGDDPTAVDRLARTRGPEQLRNLVRRVVTEWDPPARFQEQLYPYVHRQHSDALWTLEEVAIGITAVEVRSSISARLTDDTPYHIFFPADPNDPDDERPARRETWWQEGPDRARIQLGDDVDTDYQQIRSEYGACGFPLRVLVAEHWEARVAERYRSTYLPGVPMAARKLTLTGAIELAIEQPDSERGPWPTRTLSLGDFNYTIDLDGWWPRVIVDDEYLAWQDE